MSTKTRLYGNGLGEWRRGSKCDFGTVGLIEFGPPAVPLFPDSRRNIATRIGRVHLKVSQAPAIEREESEKDSRGSAPLADRKLGCSSSRGWLVAVRREPASPTRDPHAAHSLSFSLLFPQPIPRSRPFLVPSLPSTPVFPACAPREAATPYASKTEIRYDTADTPSSGDYALGVHRGSPMMSFPTINRRQVQRGARVRVLLGTEG